LASAKQAARAKVIQAAFYAHPERFPNHGFQKSLGDLTMSIVAPPVSEPIKSLGQI
jgi:hypothetical protein